MIRNFTVDISTTTSYPATAQVQVPFVGRSCSVMSRHPSAIVHVSLDGVVDVTIGYTAHSPTERMLRDPLFVANLAAWGVLTLACIYGLLG